MGFQIECKTGEMGPVTLRGCSDGTVEMCAWRDVKQSDGSHLPILTPIKYYASIEQAFDRIARMRIASAEATTLAELVKEIKRIRVDIKEEMGAEDWTRGID